MLPALDNWPTRAAGTAATATGVSAERFARSSVNAMNAKR